jgi:hypothetical protein
MDKFIFLIEKYGLQLTEDRQFLVKPGLSKKILLYWDEIPRAILEIENYHPDVDGEAEILECLEDQIKTYLNESR